MKAKITLDWTMKLIVRFTLEKLGKLSFQDLFLESEDRNKAATLSITYLRFPRL